MADWEFLLQKEGDRSWLPLKPPKVEISEGRYRVVAHSTRTNTDVEIRITHYCLNEVPPKRRFQKRSHRLNTEGLMVVIPFTYVKPGIWDLLVKNDIMSDLLGDTWQQGIQLYVLPKVTQTQASTTEKLKPDSINVPVKTSAAETPIPTETTEAKPRVAFKQESSKVASGDDELQASDSQPTKRSDCQSILVEAQPALFSTQDGDESTLEHSPQPLSSDELAKSDSTAHQHQEKVLDHDLLADSQQIAEQVFQQLADWVWQSEPTPEDQTTKTPNFASRQLQQADEGQEQQREEPNLLPTLASTNQASFLLTLDQQTLAACRGQSLTMTGRVEILDTTTISSCETQSHVNPSFIGTLRYQLRDPQSSQVLASDQLLLPEQLLPFAFTLAFDLPQNCETRLILGEVALCDTHGTLIATQSFSITADLQELLGTILQTSQALPTTQMTVSIVPQSPESQLEPPPETSPDQPEESVSLDLSLYNLLEKARHPQSFKPSPGQLLPPQITHSSLPKKAAKALQLPKLPSTQSVATQLIASEGTKNEAGGIDQELVERSKLHNSLFTEDASSLPPSAALSPADSDVQLEKADAAPNSLPPTANEVPSQKSVVGSLPQTQEAQIVALDDAVVDLGNGQTLLQDCKQVTGSIEQAFQSLRIQDRFWYRLNAMATDTEFSIGVGNEHSSKNQGEVDLAAEDALRDTWQIWEPDSDLSDLYFSHADAQEPASAERLTTGSLDLETAEQTKPAPLPKSPSPEPQDPLHPFFGNAGFDWNTQEIVVDEELPESAQLAPHDPKLVVDNLLPDALSQMFKDVQVPTPKLDIPSGELTSGEVLTLWVKLPPYQNPIYVKLWIQDLQSRTLLDGPLLLRDFVPNYSGELETVTQLNVPFGSLSISFEAIAVDMHAQRESHKVKVDRTVVPPDIPTISLDEFEN